MARAGENARVILFWEKERKGFNAEEEKRRRPDPVGVNAERREEERGKRSQRGRGKTRRLRLPVMTTARERPSGAMAKSRKLRPWRMGIGVGWETGISLFAGSCASGGRSIQTRSPDFFSRERLRRMRDSSGDQRKTPRPMRRRATRLSEARSRISRISLSRK